ncbi:MAG: winged helix-turn-helix domain-containing protein [bacterium]|nr:winged helix-turn-helix domain-containing protein [bacterium]
MNEVENAVNLLKNTLTKEEKTIYEIKKQTNLPARIIYLSLGWLLREGFIEIKKDEFNIKIKKIA